MPPVRPAAGRPGAGPGRGSPAPTRPARGPDRRPNSSASTRRARRIVRSASPWRPARYWANANAAHRCSRNGSRTTCSDRRRQRLLVCRPLASCRAPAAPRPGAPTPATRAAAATAGSQPSKSAHGSPDDQLQRRRPASAPPAPCSPTADSRSASATSRSKRRTSISSSPNSSRYPAPVVAIACAPETRAAAGRHCPAPPCATSPAAPPRTTPPPTDPPGTPGPPPPPTPPTPADPARCNGPHPPPSPAPTPAPAHSHRTPHPEHPPTPTPGQPRRYRTVTPRGRPVSRRAHHPPHGHEHTPARIGPCQRLALEGAHHEQLHTTDLSPSRLLDESACRTRRRPRAGRRRGPRRPRNSFRPAPDTVSPPPAVSTTSPERGELRSSSVLLQLVLPRRRRVSGPQRPLGVPLLVGRLGRRLVLRGLLLGPGEWNGPALRARRRIGLDDLGLVPVLRRPTCATPNTQEIPTRAWSSTEPTKQHAPRAPTSRRSGDLFGNAATPHTSPIRRCRKSRPATSRGVLQNTTRPALRLTIAPAF